MCGWLAAVLQERIRGVRGCEVQLRGAGEVDVVDGEYGRRERVGWGCQGCMKGCHLRYDQRRLCEEMEEAVPAWFCLRLGRR